MAEREGQGWEARPEDEFLEGVKLAVHRRTGQWPWMDQVEDDFLPLLAKYKTRVTGAHDAEVAAAALREAADEVHRVNDAGNLVHSAIWDAAPDVLQVLCTLQEDDIRAANLTEQWLRARADESNPR